MKEAQSAAYVGKDRSEYYRDFESTPHFSIFLECAHTSKEHGIAIMEDLSHAIQSLSDPSLPALEEAIDSFLHSHSKTSISYSVIYFSGSTVMMCTGRQGEIHLRRGKDFEKILKGDRSASGPFRSGDMYVASSAAFRERIEEEEALAKPLTQDPPEDIVKALEAHFVSKEDSGVLAVFIEPVPTREAPLRPRSLHDSRAAVAVPLPEDADNNEQETENEVRVKKGFSMPRIRLPVIPVGSQRGRILTIVGATLLIAIFIWSVIFGVQRRAEQQRQELIAATETEVKSLLDTAESEAFLNFDTALEKIAAAREKARSLSTRLGDNGEEAIKNLTSEIEKRENELLHKNDVSPELFFDLALEEKDASGTQIAITDSKAVILSPGNEKVYQLDLEKKSLEKSTHPDTANATLVGYVNDSIVFYVPDKGVQRFSSDTKVQTIIKTDSDWKSIIGMSFFGTNIYLLDAVGNDVYKYVAAGSGYGSKQSYFVENHPDLASSTSLTIDSSVYLSQSNGVLKFSKGKQEPISTSFPTQKLQIKKVVTGEDTEKLYLWDRDAQRLYVLSKSGTYEKTISAKELGHAQDLAFYNNSILVLLGSKIFKITP